MGFAVAVAMLCATMTESRANERIPFTLTNNAGGEVRVQCGGPWGRSSKFVDVEFGEPKTFYTAEQTIFTMFGAWNCSVCPINFCQLDPPAEVFFCLEKEDGDQAPVELVLGSDFDLTVNYPPEPATGDCSSASATATLGDNLSGNGVDLDSYSLDGWAGDVLTLIVAGDNTLGIRVILSNCG